MSEETKNLAKTETTEVNIKLDVEKLKTDMKKLAELEIQNKTLQEQIEKANSDKENLESQLSKHTGVGHIPLSTAQKEKEEDNNIIECSDRLDFLLKLREKSPEKYEQLKNKAFKGLAENKQSFEMKDEFINSKSIFRRILDQQNADCRKAHGYKKEVE